MSFAGCGVRVTTRRPAPPPARDLAADFLATACEADPGTPFAEAWLAHERRYWDVYAALYYRDEEALAEREALARELAPRRDEMCLHVRVFRAVAPAALDRARGEVAALMGVAPTAEVVFTAALQWTDGRTGTLGGHDLVALNARHDTFARTTGLVATLTHELIHDAQSRLGDDGVLPPLARQLYREGAAVYGTALMLRGLGDRATGLRGEQLTRASEVAPAAAAELLAALHSREPGELSRRFFSGGFRDPERPPKMGYYLGLRAFEALGRERGERAAVRVDARSFLTFVERWLAETARRGDVT